MENPFSPDFGPDISLKRNGYDLSRQGLFTTEVGQISPLLSMEVIPGDTVRIDQSQINIQGMPTLYPLQTRLRVSASFYYGRNRTVHDNFEDFIFNTKDIEAPWLRLDNARAKLMISTGSLGDMLGVPSTVGTGTSGPSSSVISDRFTTSAYSTSYLVSNISNYIGLSITYLGGSASGSAYEDWSAPFVNHGISGPLSLTLNSAASSSTTADVIICVVDSLNIIRLASACTASLVSGETLVSLTNFTSRSFNLEDLVIGNTYRFVLFSSQVSHVSKQVNFITSASSVLDATDDSVIANNPFVGINPTLKLSAYKFRLYEQICNYYYRNDKNNPYVLNGEVQYNEFIPTHADGADDNVYDFHYRNWELDRFTSCTQTPQFGEAPLVGLTYNPLKESAVLSFSGTDSEGSTQDYQVTVGIDDEGRLANIADFSKDIPAANLNKLQDMISYGISINDLRVTNSFQRFLENTLRRGLRYRNQLKSHFGTSVDYPDIDIPQYIGGFSGEFTVGRVESTADTEGAPLGDFTGKLFGQFVQQNPITCRIPEHGFIFCMFTISPIPQYPQSIDKSLLKTNYLDYFVPEFGKSLGHVPVPYAEVCPLQNYGVGQSPHDIFGYQRAYYDYMQAFDEVHGDFRTNLKDFAMLRTFSERPELGEDFTTIHPEQVNDVFVVRNVATENQSSKHFLGNFYFHITVARPIPKVGTPSLE